MNIIHIITGLNDGGAEAALYRLCISDTLDRHSVVSLLDSGKYGPLLEAHGISVVCLNLQNRRTAPQALIKLWRLLRQHQPDAVQTWMYHADFLGGLIARLAGVRAVFWGIHNTQLAADKSKPLTRLIARLCARLSHWLPRRIICCAHKAAAAHQALGYAAAKFVIIANGYDLQRFQPNAQAGLALRQSWQIGRDEWLLGMVGRYDPYKDHHNLLAALSLLKTQQLPFRCVLAGTGISTDNAELQALLARYDIAKQVLLLGQREDIPAIMNALDVHVLSSSSEAFPNVLAEAMACGTPCVTTDVGDAARIVAEYGWVVTPADATALAQALVTARQAQQDNARWQQRQRDCVQHIAQHFSIEKIVTVYRQAWQSI